ncbi:MAG: UDP-N-acetylmuramate dehydrogenase [Phocaeicola sp.]
MVRKDNFSLKQHHTFGMEVCASHFVEYNSVEELRTLLNDAELIHSPWMHIGGGSNLLFLGNYAGTIIHSAIKGVEVVKENAHNVWVKVGAGEVWDEFVLYAIEKNWYGVENLSNIPGEVGASAVQNIGAYGVEAADLIEAVHTIEVANLAEHTFLKEECAYDYRSSLFKKEWKNQYIVTGVTYKLHKEPTFCLTYGHIEKELEKRGRLVTLRNVRDTIVEIRSEKLPDPKVFGNAGSFFMNPIVTGRHFEELKKLYPAIPHYVLESGKVKIPAAWLIDQCGWKGIKQGGAGVHSNQPLVLINCGGATGREVLGLATQIQESIQEVFGITITPEVNIIVGDEGNCIG